MGKKKKLTVSQLMNKTSGRRKKRHDKYKGRKTRKAQSRASRLANQKRSEALGPVPKSFVFRRGVIGESVKMLVQDMRRVMMPETALHLRERKANIYGGWRYIDDVTDINLQLSSVSEDIRRKLLSVLYEHNDVLAAREGIEKGDFFKFARAVNHSHETMRDMFNISCPEIDWILKRVNELEPNLDFVRNPVTCGRITGKGFGRCLYAIMREGDVENFKAKITEFEKIFGFHPDVYEIETADGASIVKD